MQVLLNFDKIFRKVFLAFSLLASFILMPFTFSQNTFAQTSKIKKKSVLTIEDKIVKGGLGDATQYASKHKETFVIFFILGSDQPSNGSVRAGRQFVVYLEKKYGINDYIIFEDRVQQPGFGTAFCVGDTLFDVETPTKAEIKRQMDLAALEYLDLNGLELPVKSGKKTSTSQ